MEHRSTTDMKKQKMGKKKSDVCRAFGIVNFTLQKIWNNENKIIRALEQNGSRIKRFRKPERSDANEVLLSLFKHREVTRYQGTIPFLPSFLFY